MAIDDQETIPPAAPGASQWLSGSGVPHDTGTTPTGAAPAGSFYFRHDPADGPVAVGPAVYQKGPAYTPAGAAQAIPVGWRPLAGGDVINVKRFGAKGDGTADDSPAFNAAFDAARAATRYPVGTPPVYAPAGRYLLNSALNMTAASLNLVGDGMFQTVLVGSTGPGKCVIDMTGASYGSVTDLSIVTGAPASGGEPDTPPTFGIVWNRTAGTPTEKPAMEMNRLERVQVWMGTAAPGDPGPTVALYNCGSEVSSIHRCSLRAGTALVITLENYAQFKSDYVEAGMDGVSMTVFEADRDCELVGLGGPCVVIPGAASISIDSYLTNQGPTLTPPVEVPPFAVDVTGDTNDLYLGGSVETYPVSLAVRSARLRGLQYHHYHSHAATGNYTSNMWLDEAELIESVVHPVPAEGYQDAGLKEGCNFLIDGTGSRVFSSIIHAYGTQVVRLKRGSRDSVVAGSVIVTEGKVGDFTISGVATANGVQIVGPDGVRIGTVGDASARPAASAVAVGTQHYDVVTARPLWSDGARWRDAAGVVVP